MIKKLLYLILFILCPSFCFAQVGVVDWSTTTGPPASCQITYTQYTQQDACVYVPAASSTECSLSGTCSFYYGSGKDSGSGCKNSSFGCGYPSILPAPSGGCNIPNYENSVGGCGGSPIYCSTSPVYQKVQAFLGFIGDASRWSYYTTIGKDNNLYKCVVSFTRANGTTVIVIAGSALSTHNPVGASDCLSETEYNALKNTNCSLSSGWAINSGYATNYRDGTGTTQNPDDAEGPITPVGSPTESPLGTPITSPTGFDSNKDGFDDVTGQPLPFSPGTGGDEVTIKDPAPSAIPAVPSGGEYDSDIESPEQKTLSDIFDVIDSSPFISVLQGTHMQLSGSQCLLSTYSTVFGHFVSFNFCDSRIVDVLDYLGVIIIGIAAILAILLIFV